MLRVTQFSLLFFLLTLSPAFAEPDQYHRLALEGIALGHNMQIDSAEAIFNEMIALDPEQPLGYLAQALINLYRYRLEDKHKSNEQKFKEYTETAIKLSKKQLSNRQRLVDAWFFLGITHVFLGIYHVDRDNWLRAFWHGKQGIDYLQKVVDTDSSYYDAYLGLGLYHYYAEARLNFFLKATSSLLLGVAGDRKKGLHELQLATEKGVYARAEARFFLGYIYLDEENEYEKALACFTELANLYPDNPYFRQACVNALRNVGDYSKAIAMVNSAIHEKSSNRDLKFDISFHYMLGYLYFELNQFETASTHYHQALEIASRTPGNVKWVFAWANFYLGRIHEILGQRQEANRYYQQVKRSGDKHVYAEAQTRIKQPLLPVDIELIRGRNYAKTKNYEQALAVLETARIKANENTKDYPKRKIPEIQYRLAKTQHDKKAFAEAIVEFKKFFALKNIEEKWMEPWAHFYLGNCYQETGERQMAEAEYKIAYKYDDGALRFEIDKAREKL